MQAPLHFILKFDMMPPYDQAYRRAADVLSCPSIMSVDSTIMSLDSTATDPGGGTIILCDTNEAIGLRDCRSSPSPTRAILLRI